MKALSLIPKPTLSVLIAKSGCQLDKHLASTSPELQIPFNHGPRRTLQCGDVGVEGRVEDTAISLHPRPPPSRAEVCSYSGRRKLMKQYLRKNDLLFAAVIHTYVEGLSE